MFIVLLNLIFDHYKFLDEREDHWLVKNRHQKRIYLGLSFTSNFLPFQKSSVSFCLMGNNFFFIFVLFQSVESYGLANHHLSCTDFD
jgi:hypothetical protein